MSDDAEHRVLGPKSVEYLNRVYGPWHPNPDARMVQSLLRLCHERSLLAGPSYEADPLAACDASWGESCLLDAWWWFEKAFENAEGQ